MKKTLASILMLCAIACSAFGQNLFVGTYNIRNNGNDDALHGNGWDRRVSVICGQVLFEQPDIFGTQEVLHSQVLDLQKGLPGYDYIGVGRDDGKEAGEYECIWYNKERLTLLDSGNFWLSETPERPALGWDAACIRICSWGKFTTKTKTKTKTKKGNKSLPLGGDREGYFYFFNLHMDHIGTVARREAAKLVVRKIKEIANGAPMILTGDFNVDQNNEIYTIFTESGIMNDSYVVAEQRFAENGTFNAYDPEMKTDSRIDHIFVSPCFAVDHYAVMTNGYWREKADAIAERGANAPQEIRLRRHEMRTASDHYPVWAKIRLTNLNQTKK